MTKFAIFDEQGLPKAFYSEDVHGHQGTPGCLIPDDAIEISDEQWMDFIENHGARRWENGSVVEYTPPNVPSITVLHTVTLWERLTEAEAEQVNAAMATQPFRTRQIFLTANTFRSDHELWPLLVQMATDLFGEARAAELLAP
ncbi:hypothetical protein [Brucella sp. BO2]|uniref:hypothetical protein n=1 Tax=Brucella sp. BO2 TaxID=693750 RepID=UPI00046D48B4|nr:hypothetical protein [Brucella sp. BO2]